MKLLLLLLFLSSQAFASTKLEVATFAGGCFWCMEPPFERLIGVKEVISGYSGGNKVSPNYNEVASGQTKHREAVQVIYDPNLVSYKTLLEVFWKNIDPTDNGGQFVDRGFQYSSAIFTHNKTQESFARESLNLLKNLNKFKKVTTPIIAYKNFYKAEEYHQDYYKKDLISKTKYKYYRSRSGRDDFINANWKKGEKLFKESRFNQVPKSELKKKLSKLQYHVTQEDGTERAFNNKYWDNKKEGIYVDIVSGEPLFSSKDKYDSKTGWPSFTKAINPFYIIEVEDNKLLSTRVEVRSRFGDSHLGHVFNDGPSPLGMRYCINSAALKFIPKEKLKESGYDESLFFKVESK